MDRRDRSLANVDVGAPNMARIYDYLLGGFYNFESDRIVAGKLCEIVPELPQMAQEYRMFLRRAVRLCADAGISQFIDLGSGIPTRGNVHEVARVFNSETRVVYVDLDPVAAAHSRTMLANNDLATIVRADLRKPDTVLNKLELIRLIDFEQPIGLIMTAVLHFVTDRDDPVGIIQKYAEHLVPGSFLVVSHGSDEHRMRDMAEVYKDLVPTLRMRSRTEVEEFFDGFDLVDPGLTWLEEWRPEQHPFGLRPEEKPPARFAYGAVGRKP